MIYNMGYNISLYTYFKNYINKLLLYFINMIFFEPINYNYTIYIHLIIIHIILLIEFINYI